MNSTHTGPVTKLVGSPDVVMLSPPKSTPLRHQNAIVAQSAEEFAQKAAVASALANHQSAHEKKNVAAAAVATEKTMAATATATGQQSDKRNRIDLPPEIQQPNQHVRKRLRQADLKNAVYFTHTAEFVVLATGEKHVLWEKFVYDVIVDEPNDESRRGKK